MRKAQGLSKTSRTLLALGIGLLVLAGMVSGSGSAFAATPVAVGGKAVVANTDGDPIRVRRGPGTEYSVIAMTREGQDVTVLEGPVDDKKGIRWFRIEAAAGTGWMMAEFLRGTGPSRTTAKVALSGSARVANTDGDPLRVRLAPSREGKVLTLLDPGTVVEVQDGPVTDDDGIEWYKVEADGTTGWVMSQYLAQAAPAAAPESEKSAARAEPAVAAKPAVAEKAAEKKAEKKAEPESAASGGAKSTLVQYREWMEEARLAHPYPQSGDKMWSVMWCESRGNAWASGGGGLWLGLFQYAPATWAGRWNPYNDYSIWDAKAQIFATAKAWSIGMQSHWSCYYITAGR